LLEQLEGGDRYELANWFYDASERPHSPGLLLLYEAPFRLLYVDDCENLHNRLDSFARGLPTDFTRGFFHYRVASWMSSEQSSQLLEGIVSTESIVSVFAKQVVSYRFIEVSDPALRTEAAARARSKGLRVGLPTFVKTTS
jgi:hypothetical protein